MVCTRVYSRSLVHAAIQASVSRLSRFNLFSFGSAVPLLQIDAFDRICKPLIFAPVPDVLFARALGGIQTRVCDSKALVAVNEFVDDASSVAGDSTLHLVLATFRAFPFSSRNGVFIQLFLHHLLTSRSDFSWIVTQLIRRHSSQQKGSFLDMNLSRKF